MSNKREQRLRRKARAALRAAETRLAEAAELRPIALAGIRYIAEIDAPNPHEPWSIANRRDELRDVVHAHQGRPQRGSRREPQAVRAPAPVVPLRSPVATAPKPTVRVHVPASHAVNEQHPSRELLLRDIEVKRAELHNAAKRLGAEANKRRRDASRVAELSAALDVAAKAFSVAEAQLRVADMRLARAIGAAS